MGESIGEFRIYSTHVCKSTQAASEQMDRVEQQLEYVHSGQKEEADWAMEYGIFGLKTEILCEVDPEIATLETRLEVKVNEAY